MFWIGKQGLRQFREVYGYKVLFGDAFDNIKYAVTSTKLCRIGFAMLEDSGYEDMQDAHSVDEEGSKLSNEGERTDRAISSIDVSRP